MKSTLSASPMAVALAFAMLAGCSSLKPAADGAASSRPGAQTTQVWQYPASEYPTMCLLLEPGGNARFVGGFLYFNPSSWRADAASGLTLLTVGGGHLPLPPAPPAASAAQTAVVRVDEARRTISYRLDAQTAAIDFGGFTFFRTAACSA